MNRRSLLKAFLAAPVAAAFPAIAAAEGLSPIAQSSGDYVPLSREFTEAKLKEAIRACWNAPQPDFVIVGPITARGTAGWWQ